MYYALHADLLHSVYYALHSVYYAPVYYALDTLHFNRCINAVYLILCVLDPVYFSEGLCTEEPFAMLSGKMVLSGKTKFFLGKTREKIFLESGRIVLQKMCFCCFWFSLGKSWLSVERPIFSLKKMFLAEKPTFS